MPTSEQAGSMQQEASEDSTPAGIICPKCGEYNQSGGAAAKRSHLLASSDDYNQSGGAAAKRIHWKPWHLVRRDLMSTGVSFVDAKSQWRSMCMDAKIPKKWVDGNWCVGEFQGLIEDEFEESGRLVRAEAGLACDDDDELEEVVARAVAEVKSRPTKTRRTIAPAVDPDAAMPDDFVRGQETSEIMRSEVAASRLQDFIMQMEVEAESADVGESSAGADKPKPAVNLNRVKLRQKHAIQKAKLAQESALEMLEMNWTNLAEHMASALEVWSAEAHSMVESGNALVQQIPKSLEEIGKEMDMLVAGDYVAEDSEFKKILAEIEKSDSCKESLRANLSEASKQLAKYIKDSEKLDGKKGKAAVAESLTRKLLVAFTGIENKKVLGEVAAFTGSEIIKLSLAEDALSAIFAKRRCGLEYISTKSPS